MCVCVCVCGCVWHVFQRNADSDAEKASLLAIAQYNKGVELEHLKQRKEAVVAYKAAYKVCACAGLV